LCSGGARDDVGQRELSIRVTFRSAFLESSSGKILAPAGWVPFAVRVRA
jgi:hypothetical protein